MKTVYLGRLSLTLSAFEGPRKLGAGWGRMRLGDRFAYLWTGAYLVFLAVHLRSQRP